MKALLGFLLAIFFVLGIFVLLDNPVNAQTQEIPSYVKKVAQLWNEGKVDDKTFSNAVGFLIDEKIIVLDAMPSQQQTLSTKKGIPGWIKQNAGFWNEGKISDKTFLDGIGYLVEQGIIPVG